MRHKLKAVFDDRSKAQQALDELLGSGYSSADAALVTVPGAVPGSAGEQPAPKWRERPGTASARLLSRFFDHAESSPVATSRPRLQDSYILTLSTDTAPEAERAAFLISGFMHTDSEDAGIAPSDGQPGIATAGYRRAVAPGALQYHARDTSHYFGTRDPADTSTIGTTFREPMLPGHWPGAPTDGPSMEGVHSGPPVGDHVEHAAYRFGHDLHENDRYRNRSWQEAHADLKILWEASDPDRPDWETSEPAVHLGWNSTSPEIDDDSYHRSHWRTGYASSAAQAGAPDGPGSTKASPVPDSAWKQRHPGEFTAWENFIDALKHGWDRIRIGNDMDEADYRLHHANTYPGTNYDDLAPVYRYGHNVRRRSAFRNRSWDDVEDELRAEWERGHREGKPATWDVMKAALHQGWDHVKT